LIKIESSAKPLIELTFASVFWGFGFTATIWALKFIDSPAIIFYRFLGAFLAGLLVLFLMRTSLSVIKNEFKLSFSLGFFLALTLILQTWGLKYTTATKSAFITTLYVVLVPLITTFLLKESLSKRHWFWVFWAIVGTLLIVELNFSQWTIGDSFTFLNALTAAIHIILMGKIAPKSSNHFALNVGQSLWIFLFSSVFLFTDTRWNFFDLDNKAIFGMLMLIFGSSLLAFWLQVRAQDKINPSLASIMFLLESPFSFLFAFMLLGERLSWLQALGCLIIFISCVGACMPKSPKVAAS
jgi:drug/metabolite transporter (DMT)-like permease